METSSAQGDRFPMGAANQGLARALLVLEAVEKVGEARVADVARICGVGTSTVSRLLATLVAYDYVMRDEVTGLYRLGPQLVALAGSFLNQSRIYREARPVAHEVSTKLGLGVNIVERRGDSLIYLLAFDGVLGPRNHALLGQSAPAHATGVGKCLLSTLDKEALTSFLSRVGLPAYTAFTITDESSLAEQLHIVRQRGYATEHNELRLGRACVAAPIRSGDGFVVAAISISGPNSALKLEHREPELAEAVIEAADRIGSGILVSRTPKASFGEHSPASVEALS